MKARFFLQHLLPPPILPEHCVGHEENRGGMSLYPAEAPSLLGKPSRAEKPHAERVVLQVTQTGGSIREGCLEVVALGLNKLPGSPERPRAWVCSQDRG